METAYQNPETVYDGLRRVGVAGPLAAVCAASLHRYLFGKPPEFV